MDFKYFFKKIFSLTFFLFFISIAFSQTTIVKGTVTDAHNEQPLPGVNITFKGTTTGVTTNNQGKYVISSDKPYRQLKISILGYKDAYFPIEPGKEQLLNISLFTQAQQLNEVEVNSGKKQKYSNKDNPAVELIRKVIENKEKNRPGSYPFVEYREYDKIQFSLNNIPATASGNRYFHQYKFILDNRDSTTIPGKSLMPIFLNEKLLQYYYRKTPEKEKTITLAEKTVNFGQDIDSEGIGLYMKYIYYKVDIYSNSILLMTRNFLSPIANSAQVFYKYFITDTITENNVKLVELSFIPRNTTDLLFEGKIYITLDGNYAVQKAELTVDKNINLDFINSVRVDLEFEQNPDGRYHLSKSRTLADFSLRKKGLDLFGIRAITYKNYIVSKPHPDTTYKNQEPEVPEEAKHRSDQFWSQNRLDTLTTAESKTYKNIDSLMNMRSFKLTMDILTILFGGYKNFGPYEIGPISNFYSFNPVEGFRPQFGGRSTDVFSKRYYFGTYAAYGFKDERWKYYLSAAYSLNDKSIYKFPQNYIMASVQRDITIPGEDLTSVGENNFFFSFKRGNNYVYLYDYSYRLDYIHEYENHFSYSFGINRLTQSPAGALYFQNTDNNNETNPINNLITTTFTASLRYAPHEQFYQGKIYRSPVTSKYPVISLDYSNGVKNVFDGQYNYQKLHASINKHFYLSQLGFADVTVDAGRLFGQVPFPLLNIFPANQTYFYNIYSYNLMNYLEFVSDHYESINIDQHFVGFFFNKIPLLKKLKWREVASFKAIYGGLSNENNPSLHPALYQFPVTSTGQPITYALGNTPYVEGSVGIENIFKIVRLDLVRRFTYLDHPDVSAWGLRVSFQLIF